MCRYKPCLAYPRKGEELLIQMPVRQVTIKFTFYVRIVIVHYFSVHSKESFNPWVLQSNINSGNDRRIKPMTYSLNNYSPQYKRFRRSLCTMNSIKSTWAVSIYDCSPATHDDAVPRHLSEEESTSFCPNISFGKCHCGNNKLFLLQNRQELLIFLTSLLCTRHCCRQLNVLPHKMLMVGPIIIPTFQNS